MINLNIYLLLSLIGVFLVGGIISAFAFGFWWAFPLLLIGLILLLVYIFFGSVNSAAKHIQAEEFDEAEKKLDLTWRPQWLYVTQRAFYYIMKGAIAMSKKDMKTAESHFDTALALNLPSDNERGMILLQLANINATKGKWKAAKNYFRQAKKLDITEGPIVEQLSQLEKAMNQGGQGRMAQTMGGRMGGQVVQPGSKSKRRKPRMR